jgi:hypothetical protein
MASKGLDSDPNPAKPAVIAKLKLQQFGAEASILVPSIMNIEVQEDMNRLIVYGQFGSVAGSAKIDNLDRAPSPWTNDAMVIDLPVNSSGSSGPVVVVGPDGQLSNAVPLTDFNGTMTLTRKLDLTLGAPGFTDVADCTLLRFRADVHRYRTAPGVAPSDASLKIDNFARNITCTWKMTGSDATRSVNDSGGLPWADNTVNGGRPFISGSGTLQGGASPILTLNINCAADADMLITIPPAGPTHTNGPMICIYGTESATLTLQSDFSFPEQTVNIPTLMVPAGASDTATLKIHFNANSAPDPTTPS